MSIIERFVPNKDLLLVISWLEPVKYKETIVSSTDGFLFNALRKLSELTGMDRKTLSLLKFKALPTRGGLCSERLMV